MNDLEIYIKTTNVKLINNFILETFGECKQNNTDETYFFKYSKFTITVKTNVNLESKNDFSSIYISNNKTDFLNDLDFGTWVNKKLNIDIICNDNQINPYSWKKISDGKIKIISHNDI